MLQPLTVAPNKNWRNICSLRRSWLGRVLLR
jgi:hypothetical protein